MFYNSTLLLIAGSDLEHLSELYSPLLAQSLHDTMNNGMLDIMVMRNQNTVRAVEKITATMYDLTRAKAAELGRKNINVTVLLDGQSIETSRKQTWEVVVVGKYGTYTVFLFVAHFINNISLYANNLL